MATTVPKPLAFQEFNLFASKIHLNAVNPPSPKGNTISLNVDSARKVKSADKKPTAVMARFLRLISFNKNIKTSSKNDFLIIID